jgi:hypothetical protein
MSLLRLAIAVPRHERIVVAARTVPADWPTLIYPSALESLADAYPDWPYMVAGFQERRVLRPGFALMHNATVNRWPAAAAMVGSAA